MSEALFITRVLVVATVVMVLASIRLLSGLLQSIILGPTWLLYVGYVGMFVVLLRLCE